LLLQSAIEFPVLLTKVIYDGTHAGDRLDMSDVERLSHEIGHLRTIHSQEGSEEQVIREFEQQMSELVAASRQVQKPIVF
jgi:hypothetical protein